MVVTKYIYFSLTILWDCISDNIAGVVGGPQYREGEGDLFPSSNYLDDVFTWKDLLDLGKT